LLDEVEAGEEVEITRYGKLVAQLKPARGQHALLGMFEGIASTAHPGDDLFSTGVEWNLP
jgi:antitoxin (DNA-binding transcriptional repressor) of toxin-antitoxin stability system